MWVGQGTGCGWGKVLDVGGPRHWMWVGQGTGCGWAKIQDVGGARLWDKGRAIHLAGYVWGLLRIVSLWQSIFFLIIMLFKCCVFLMLIILQVNLALSIELT